MVAWLLRSISVCFIYPFCTRCLLRRPYNKILSQQLFLRNRRSSTIYNSHRSVPPLYYSLAITLFFVLFYVLEYKGTIISISYNWQRSPELYTGTLCRWERTSQGKSSDTRIFRKINSTHQLRISSVGLRLFSWGRTNTKGLKITEKRKVLPLPCVQRARPSRA